jgi:hypothetical protein
MTGVRVVVLALSLVLTAFFASAGAAQAAAPHVPNLQWESVLGNGSARSVQQAADGGYLVAGWTPGGAGSPTASTAQPGAGTDIFVIKTDGWGRKVWERVLLGNGFSTGYGVIQTSDGGAVVVGDTKSKTGTDHDVFVAKLDARGNEVWEKNYGGPRCDYGAAVLQTGDGGYLVAGGTESFGIGIYNAYLIRLDAQGRQLWQHTYGGKGTDCGYALLQAGDGGYVIAGSSDSTPSRQTNVYLIKVDDHGRLLWERRYGGDRDSYGWSLLQTGDGYLIAGETEVTGATGGGYRNCVIETDAQGNEIREQIYGGDSYGTAYAVWPAGDGGYLLAGKREATGGVHYLDLTWTDANGGSELDRTLAGLGVSCAYAGQPTRDGGSIVAGEQIAAAGGGQEIILVKLAPDNRAALVAQSITLIVIIPILVLLAYMRRKHLL